MPATLIDGNWLAIQDGDERGFAIYMRHYSAHKNPAGKFHGVDTRRRLYGGIGERMMLLSATGDALFVWRIEKWRKDGQTGVQCSIFRNESPVLSSELIREADALADQRWPGMRHWTYVDGRQVRHKRDPGRCFKKAGWIPCGMSKGGLTILERT